MGDARFNMAAAAIWLALGGVVGCRSPEPAVATPNDPKPSSSSPAAATAQPSDLKLTFAPQAGTPAAPAGPAGPTAMVTDLASGWPVTLRIGQQMTVRLTTTRSAGERWSLRPGSDGGLVRLQGPAVFEPGGASGGAGAEVFRVEAVKVGKTDLTFDLTRGSGTAPAKSASYPVTVQ
jgi:predicted secreted protein